MDLHSAFLKRFQIAPKTSAIRNRIIETGNLQGFVIAQSGITTKEFEWGLFAVRDYTAGTFLGTYRGEYCLTKDLEAVIEALTKKDQKPFDEFMRAHGICSVLSPQETCKQMVRLGFVISDDTFLVMPKFPIDLDFYHQYNAMLFVNEPPKNNVFWNPVLEAEQHSQINVVAHTNAQWQTIDYIAAVDIPAGTELLVYYGNRYKREHY